MFLDVKKLEFLSQENMFVHSFVTFSFALKINLRLFLFQIFGSSVEKDFGLYFYLAGVQYRY